MGNYDDGPRIIIWETIHACARACTHCRAEAIPHRDPRELTTGEACGLFVEVLDDGRAILILTSGDPFRRRDLFEIVGYASSRDLRVAVSPSGTGRVTKTRSDVWRQLNERVRVNRALGDARARPVIP